MSDDTSPEAARIQADVLERLGPDARLRLAFQMSEAVRDLARARIRAENPTFDEIQVRNQLVWELYGIRLGS